MGEAVTTTAPDGTFLLAGVELGSRELRARHGAEIAAFEERARPVTIFDGGTDVGDIALPSALGLTATGHTKTVDLAWSPAAADGFVDYQLFRDWQPEVSQTNDYRIHTSSDPLDTAFVDGANHDGTIAPEQTLYYRIVSRDTDGGRAASAVTEGHTPEWDQTVFSEHWELEVDSAFTGQGAIGGLAWDGTALWLAYRTPVGDYYDPDIITLVRRDLATGATLASFTYDDLYADLAGLAWDGSSLWLGYYATGQSGLHEIDPSTGDVLATFAMPEWTYDIDWDGSHLVLISAFATASVLDPTSGAVLATHDVPFANATRGIACRDGHLWTISWTNDDIAILGADGVQVGYAHTDLYDTLGWWYESGLKMTFVGDRLALAVEGSVYLLDPVAVP
jgi:hypothetical protein